MCRKLTVEENNKVIVKIEQQFEKMFLDGLLRVDVQSCDYMSAFLQDIMSKVQFMKINVL